MENVNSQQFFFLLFFFWFGNKRFKDLQSTQKETRLSTGTLSVRLQLNCKHYCYFSAYPRWNSYQEQLGSHWSPLNIKETSKPGNPLAVNDQKLRRGVVSRGVVACLWSFVLPKYQLQVIVWGWMPWGKPLSQHGIVGFAPGGLWEVHIEGYKLLLHRGYYVMPLLWQGCLQCLLISSPYSVLVLNHPSSFVTSQCLEQIYQGLIKLCLCERLYLCGCWWSCSS